MQPLHARSNSFPGDTRCCRRDSAGAQSRLLISSTVIGVAASGCHRQLRGLRSSVCVHTVCMYV